jgi:hypothetical protein
MMRRRGFLGGLLAAPFAASKATTAPVPSPDMGSVGIGQGGSLASWGEAVMENSWVTGSQATLAMESDPADYWMKKVRQKRWLSQNRPQWLVDSMKRQARSNIDRLDSGYVDHDILSHRSWSASTKIRVARERWVEARFREDEEEVHLNWAESVWDQTIGRILPWERD